MFYRFSALALPLTLLAGCPTDDTGKTTDTMETGDTDTGGDTFGVNATWSGTGVTVAITAGTDTTGYDFGMAQTGSDSGWAGEDCLSAIPAGYDYMSDGDGAYQFCHHLTQTGGSLSTVLEISEIVEGSTTLFSQGLEASITYVLFEGSSDACWSWGDDVGYYADKMCSDV